MRAAVAALAALVPLAAAGASADNAPRLLFSADLAPAVSGEVYVLAANGRAVDVSRSPWNDQRPALSPDGARVAFTSDRGGAPAVYTVDADGRHLRRVLRAPTTDNGLPLYAWSPDGRTLAVAALGPGDPALARGYLYLVRGGRARRVAPLIGAAQLRWTPDGKAVTYLDGSLVARDAATGRIAWQAPIESASSGWTAGGLFAGDGGGDVVVVDEQGRVLHRFAGTGATFAPDGAYLASIDGGALEIRSAAGTLLHRVRIRGLNPNVALLWAGPHTLFSGTGHDVDAATGRVRVDNGPWPLTAAVAGATFAKAAPAGRSFAILVRRGDAAARDFGRVPGCYDDGAYIPALDVLAPAADGTAVAYASRCYEPFGNLYALAGTSPQRITTAQAEQVEPEGSPDGAHIAYAQASRVGLSCKGCPVSIWTADADGSHARQLTRPVESFDDDPTWSPDGKTILFSRSDPSSFGELYTVPAAGGPLTDLHVAGADPAWGPSRIAYLTDGPGGSALWVAAPDGTGALRIARGVSLRPAWSRGGLLAFLLGRTSVGVWNGSRVRMFRLPVVATSIAWSPDGTSLAVTAKAGAPVFDVYTVALDGTHLRRLTTNVDARDVSWR